MLAGALIVSTPALYCSQPGQDKPQQVQKQDQKSTVNKDQTAAPKPQAKMTPAKRVANLVAGTFCSVVTIATMIGLAAYIQNADKGVKEARKANDQLDASLGAAIALCTLTSMTYGLIYGPMKYARNFFVKALGESEPTAPSTK